MAPLISKNGSKKKKNKVNYKVSKLMGFTGFASMRKVGLLLIAGPEIISTEDPIIIQASSSRYH